MHNHGTSLRAADNKEITRPYGISNPWLDTYRAGTGAGVRFTHFEHMPDTKGIARTTEKFMTPSLPRQHPMPGSEELKDKWPQYISAARTAWGEITEDELLNLKSHTQQLAGLIHARYAVTPEEADMQVRRFFAKNHF